MAKQTESRSALAQLSAASRARVVFEVLNALNDAFQEKDNQTTMIEEAFNLAPGKVHELAKTLGVPFLAVWAVANNIDLGDLAEWEASQTG